MVQVSYCETGNSSPREPREPRGPPGPEEVERLRKLHCSSSVAAKEAKKGSAAQEAKVAKPRKAIDSGKGVRIQVGNQRSLEAGSDQGWGPVLTVTDSVRSYRAAGR